MKSKDEISKGPKKRDPACFQTLHAILIPAGTILRQHPDHPRGIRSCPVAHGEFLISLEMGEAHPDTFRKVIA